MEKQKKVKLKVKDENHVEVITYKIPYYIESDGLIFYKFTRSSKEVERQGQEQEQHASVTDDLALIANGKAIYDIANDRNDKTQEQGEQEEAGQKSQPEPALCIDVSDLMFLRDMADKWMKFNMALESHPDSQNSASPAIIAGCRKFHGMPILKKYMKC